MEDVPDRLCSPRKRTKHVNISTELSSGTHGHNQQAGEQAVLYHRIITGRFTDLVVLHRDASITICFKNRFSVKIRASLFLHDIE